MREQSGAALGLGVNVDVPTRLRLTLQERVGDAERQDVVAPCQGFGHLLLDRRVDRVDVGELEAKPCRQCREDLLVGRHLLRHEGLPEGLARGGLRPELRQTLRREHPLKGERVDEPFVGERGVGHR